jgi:hypothetical protein
MIFKKITLGAINMSTLVSLLTQAYQNGNYDQIFSIFEKPDEMIDRYNKEWEDLSFLLLSFVRDFGRTGNPVLLNLLDAIPFEFMTDYIYDQDEAFLQGLQQAPVDTLKERMEQYFNRSMEAKYYMTESDGKAFLEFLPDDMKPFFKSCVDYKGNH